MDKWWCLLSHVYLGFTCVLDSDGDSWLSALKAFARDSVQRFRGMQKEVHDLPIEFDPLIVGGERATFAFTDGGSTLIDLLGGSMYLVRAAAAYFDPPAAPTWKMKTDAGLTTLSRDADGFTAIVRDTLEIDSATRLLEHSPDFVVLDNSLASYATTGVPHSVIEYFTPRGTSDGSPEFEYFDAFVSFMKAFDLLIDECIRRGTILIGAAKDPRSRSLCRKLGISSGLMDRTMVALAADGRTGFTKPIATSYLKVPRVSDYLERNGILTNGHGDFETVYGILAPRAPVFRLDYLSAQKSKLARIKEFVTSLHDGHGYLLPSHVVHDRARITDELSVAFCRLIKAEMAREDMSSAEAMLGDLRRARFG